MSLYKASYYNLRVAHRDSTLLFNGKTGALLSIDEQARAALAPLLGPERSRQAGMGYGEWRPARFGVEDVPTELRESWLALLDAGIFIEEGKDEREQLRVEYRAGRAQSPFYVTITTTLDCNMRCYYCYQKDGELDHMSFETCDKIVEWIQQRLIERGHERLYLDWYGGEPMLNREVIERLSARLIPFCDAHGVIYKASMICNGTNWPSDVGRFLADTRMYRVQFSLDGPERFHNKRRGTLREDGLPGRNASYDEVMRTVDAVVGKLRVDLRINVDPWVGWSCLELVDETRERGWLDAKDFHPYVAIINAMTEHCGFIDKHTQFSDFQAEFDLIQREFYRRLEHKNPKALERAMYYPSRRLINCGAVNDNAVVFGPNGEMYKCGLDVGDDFRAHAHVDGTAAQPASTRAVAESPGTANAAPKRTRQLPTVQRQQLSPDRWDRYDPFSHTRCKECQYLPVCLGGCPKSQIERNEVQIRASSAFFEHNFERMIREYYDSADRAALAAE